MSEKPSGGSWLRIGLLLLGLLLVAWLLRPLIARAAIAKTTGELSREIKLACDRYTVLIGTLALYYNQTLRGAGQADARRIELWHSPGGHTWTLLIVHSDETACIIDGTGWLKR